MKSLYILNFAVSYFAIILLFGGVASSIKNPKLSIYQLVNGHLQPLSETLQDRDDLLVENRAAVLPSYKQNNDLNKVLKIYKVLSIPDNEIKLPRLLNAPTKSKLKYTLLKTEDQDVEDGYETNKIYKDLTIDESVDQLPILRAAQKQNNNNKKNTNKIVKKPPPQQKAVKKKIQPVKPHKNISKPKPPIKKGKKWLLRTNENGRLEPDVPHIHMYRLLNNDNYENREQSDEQVSLQELPHVLENILNDGPSDVKNRDDNERLKQRLKSQRQKMYMMSQSNDGKESLDHNIPKGAAYQILSLLAKNDGKPINVENENGLYVKTYRLDEDKENSGEDDLRNTLNHGNKKVILLPIKTIMNTESKSKNDPRNWAAHFDALDSGEKEGKDLIHFIDSTNDTEPKNFQNFDDMTRLDEHAKVLQLLAKKGVLPKSLKNLSPGVKQSYKAAPLYLRTGYEGSDRTAPPRIPHKYDENRSYSD